MLRMSGSATSYLAMSMCILGSVAMCSPASAQDSAPASAEPGPTDIVVTARKRSEDVLKTPVAVSVITDKDIARKGLTSVTDLAANTPGMNTNNSSSGRADRSFQQIIIRGFTPSTTTSTTTATFIDGAPVASPTAFSSITDPARVEILKGPQSAYFGRNTFAGAMNVVNKLPTGEWGGGFSAMLGTRKNYRTHLDVEGPIIGDALTFRLSGDMFGKDGSYRNRFSGETLGDQSSKSATALVVAKPFEGLTIKAFGLYSRDSDGPAAQGLISARELKDAAGNIIVANQSNCTLSGRPNGTTTANGAAVQLHPFICGAAPALSSTSPSANTLVDQNVRNLINRSAGRLISPSQSVQGYGLLRRYHHYHLAADYVIADTGLTLSSITSTNREAYSVLADLDNYGSTAVSNSAAAIAAGAATYWTYPFLIDRTNRDFSQEVRLAFDNGGPLKATIGGSYLNNRVQVALGGGTGNLTPATPLVSTAGLTQSRTKGAFFALSYKFFDKLTLNAEGRYQVDTLLAYAQPLGLTATTNDFVPQGFYAGGSEILRGEYKNFLPRVIAQYDFDRNLMAYASWAKGVNPGQFNTSFLTSPAATVRAAAAAGIKVGVRPEKVTNYEIGIKGRALDGRLRFTLDGYFAQWRDQINAIALSLLDPNTNTPQLIQGTANTGSVDMKGIEADATYAASDLISFNASGALTDSKIKSYAFPTVSQLTGVYDFSGKEMPNTSKWSAAAGIQFGGKIAGKEPTSWFARADYVYKSGVWSNAANVTRTPDYHNVNVRVGVTAGAASIDLFVNNVFDSKAYTSIADNYLFTPNFAFTSTTSAVTVGLRELRTFGTVMRYRF